MLNQRQIEILLEFSNHKNEFLTASHFADKMNVSVRTIQGDMKVIKNELENEACAQLVSKSSKGSSIEIQDYEAFSAFVNSLYQKYTAGSLNDPNSRLSQILLLLLSRHRALSYYDLEEKFFISRSTLLNDLKKIENILDKYHLELLRNNNKILIDGSELAKRRCISDQDIYLVSSEEEETTYIDERRLAKIKNILTQVFVEYKYHIMDTDFSNIVLLLNISLCRIMDGFSIQSDELDISEDLHDSLDIAQSVYDALHREFFVKISKEEVQYLALYLNGRGNNHDQDTISQEISDFVLTSLQDIKEHFGVDFCDNIN